MKVISGISDRVAKILCHCCQEDHFVLVDFNKHYDAKDQDEYVFEFTFDIKDDRYSYHTLKQRLRDSINLVRNEDNFRHEESVDMVLMTPDMMAELYEEMRLWIDKLLTDEERDKIRLSEKPDFVKKYVRFKAKGKFRKQKNDWVELYPFRGSDGLTWYIDHFEDDTGRVYLHDFGLGWFFTKSYTNKQIRQYSLRYLFKKGWYGMRQMYCSLNKAEAIKFLGTINWVFRNAKKDEKGLSYIMID